MNNIHSGFKHGNNFKIGSFCVIKDGVEVGDNVEVGNFVLLGPGTKIGNNCYIDSYVISSGDNNIRDNVTIRYQSIIARGVIVEEGVFFAAGVRTAYLDYNREESKDNIVIGKNSFLGDAVVVMHGVKIAENCVIGANALVTRNTEPNGVYIGVPAKRIRDV